jgi:hypothetical protein
MIEAPPPAYKGPGARGTAAMPGYRSPRRRAEERRVLFTMKVSPPLRMTFRLCRAPKILSGSASGPLHQRTDQRGGMVQISAYCSMECGSVYTSIKPPCTMCNPPSGRRVLEHGQVRLPPAERGLQVEKQAHLETLELGWVDPEIDERADLILALPMRPAFGLAPERISPEGIRGAGFAESSRKDGTELCRKPVRTLSRATRPWSRWVRHQVGDNSLVASGLTLRASWITLAACTRGARALQAMNAPGIAAIRVSGP